MKTRVKSDIYWGWFNQPESGQPYHDLHRLRCVINDSGKETITVHFAEGEGNHIEVPRDVISRGTPP